MTPAITETYIKREKYSLAFLLSPSPSVFATRAEPPAPIIKPRVPSIIRYGIMKFTAANAVFFANVETKKPSTTP